MSTPPERAKSNKTVAQYGAWKSPITADLLTQKNVSFGEIAVTSCSAQSADVVFVENRPQESGRAALVKKTIDLQTLQVSQTDSGKELDLTRGEHNARSGVHEYGGGALASTGNGSLLFTAFKTYGVYEVVGDGEPQKLTVDNSVHRFADFNTHPVAPLFVCVLEDHTHDVPSEVVNSLVVVNKRDASVRTLVSGSDFYSSPRISPDGRLLAWVSWNHPSMPFFATQLWVAELIVDSEGKTANVGEAKLVGQVGADEVSHHPVWADESTLLFSNDASGFANLYNVEVQRAKEGCELSKPRPICRKPITSEFITPAWSLNDSCFDVLSAGWIACSIVTKAVSSLALLNTSTGELRRLQTPFVVMGQLRALGPSAIVFVGVQSNEPSAVVVMDLSNAIHGSLDPPRWQIVKRSSTVVEQGVVPRDFLTKADLIEFPTQLPNGEHTTAHAIIFPPCNPDYMAPAGTSPPCIVKIHGGPTSCATPGLNLPINYWTSRGYMICMVNYGGSTGYGRKYMQRLEGEWGEVDVRDAVAAANYLGSSDQGSEAKEARARRRISQEAQMQFNRLVEKRHANGAVELTLSNPGFLSVGVTDVVVTAALTAAGALTPGLQIYHGLAAAGLAWVFSKMMHVQQESVMAIPTVGLQVTTTRGFTLPRLMARKKPSADNDCFFTTSTHHTLIPRDSILDLVTNEAFRRWGVVDYVAVATRSPRGSEQASRGNRLDVLFSNQLPKLPVVEYVYRSLYPVLFGHDVSLTAEGEGGDVEKAPVGGSTLPLADPSKIAISGGSAGGFTVLASLCLYPRAFSAGCSSYGVSDIAGLDAESHKFESHYTERLMGGTPAQVPEVFRKRSPINMADRITSPVLLLQGDEDKIVPPEQSESIYKELQHSGTKVKYILFPGEGHGFRMAKHIKQALGEEEEWYKSCFHIS